MTNNIEKYAEIIRHEHYEPKNHPRMPREQRAAQFSPFAALNGYDKILRNVVKKSELISRRIIRCGDDMEN